MLSTITRLASASCFTDLSSRLLCSSTCSVSVAIFSKLSAACTADSLCLRLLSISSSTVPAAILSLSETLRITSVISTVALWVWFARLEISVATTAKPLPASPARAASMLAFKASRLVWLATFVIISIMVCILAVCSASSFISSTAWVPAFSECVICIVSVCRFSLPSRTLSFVSAMRCVIVSITSAI